MVTLDNDLSPDEALAGEKCTFGQVPLDDQPVPDPTAHPGLERLRAFGDVAVQAILVPAGEREQREQGRGSSVVTTSAPLVGQPHATRLKAHRFPTVSTSAAGHDEVDRSSASAAPVAPSALFSPAATEDRDRWGFGRVWTC